jgi:hypothetical protein
MSYRHLLVFVTVSPKERPRFAMRIPAAKRL